MTPAIYKRVQRRIQHESSVTENKQPKTALIQVNCKAYRGYEKRKVAQQVGKHKKHAVTRGFFKLYHVKMLLLYLGLALNLCFVTPYDLVNSNPYKK